MWFFESFQKVWPQSSVLRWEAFEELIQSPKKSTADPEPAVSAPVFGAPYQPYFQQPKFSVFWLLAAVGVKFLEKMGPVSALWGTKMGPRINPSGYIYIYIYIYCCILEWGVYLLFNRSIMLPGMRSKMGHAA